MAEPDGTLLGNGFTDIKESKLFLKRMWNSGEIQSPYKTSSQENGKVPE
jgi:hypothetical protein